MPPVVVLKVSNRGHTTCHINFQKFFMVDRRDILLLEALVLLRDAILPQPFRQIPRPFITAMKLYASCRAGYENRSGEM